MSVGSKPVSVAQGTDDRQRDDEIITRLLELHRRMQGAFEQAAASVDLAPPEAAALHHLDVPAPMRAMADAMCCDASYVTVLADRLESLGLVERVPDPDDRRVRRLELTPEGRRRRTELVSAIHASSPPLVALDERQRGQLLRLLRTMAAPS